MASKQEKEYMGKVAALGCIIGILFGDKDCGGRVEVHHKTGAGMGKRASDFDVMPLCTNHHSAQTPLPFGHSVHKGTKSFEACYATQDKLIEETRSLIDA